MNSCLALQLIFSIIKLQLFWHLETSAYAIEEARENMMSRSEFAILLMVTFGWIFLAIQAERSCSEAQGMFTHASVYSV